MSTRKIFSGILPQAILLFGCLLAVKVSAQTPASMIGREVAIPRHLQDGDEYQLSIPQLIAFGEKLFTARWTVQQGAGRPLSKGTANGPRLSDTSTPLVFPFNFNRLSGPDANSCSGCHNLPSTGGGGDRVTNVFVLGQRFDFVSFEHRNSMSTGGALDERDAFEALSPYEKDYIIEFLKTLQVLPPGTKSLAVDENAKSRTWQESFALAQP